ncbi:MAG: energy coupling factor transporter S component ThiW [archaeon]|nr:energy coupling factor transporter S component ThiW [archaeon]
MSETRVVNVRAEKTVLKIVITAMMIALGAGLSYFNPFLPIPMLGGSIPNPFIHMINAIIGVWLGPFYALLFTVFVTPIRIALDVGSFFGYPGSIPGAITVGTIALIISKKAKKNEKSDEKRKYAALFEPFATIFIGGTISQLYSGLNTLLFWWIVFGVSCIPGAIAGFLILIALEKRNITHKNFE